MQKKILKNLTGLQKEANFSNIGLKIMKTKILITFYRI